MVVLTQHDVFRLDVSMDDPFGVRCGESFRDREASK
jgi:hypothetical protein